MIVNMALVVINCFNYEIYVCVLFYFWSQSYSIKKSERRESPRRANFSNEFRDLLKLVGWFIVKKDLCVNASIKYYLFLKL